MVNRIFICLLIVSGLLLSGCKKSGDQDEQRFNWSTEAPLTIPFKTRLQRFDKGNLIRNYSFETGRTFALDTSRISFVIDGWQQVGQHVQWVDTRNDSLFSQNEAFSGYRSVKIIRNNAYETDEQGDGIMSDFIKVIPGNYSLSFFTKLENIYPVKTRLGIKMFDAVDVRLLYFDRNKIEISPKQKFPQIDQSVNISFKSLSLANYTHIQSFGWGKIIGKSEHFPFPDGDIPSQAHYVRIFIGLKGKGTMWIDSVSFSYSGRNFSVNERMQVYTDTAYKLNEAIVPTPKKYQKLESVVFQSPGMQPEQQPLIIVPAHPDALTDKAARLLQNALRIPGKRIIKESDQSQIEKSRLVFSLGETDLQKQFQLRLPENAIRQYPQGYYIHTTGEMPNLVFLGGSNSMAIYYAALTVLQMIDKKQPVYHNARIIDYPDFTNRYYAVKVLPDSNIGKQVDFAEELSRYKLNGAFYEANDEHSVTLPQPLDKIFSVKRIPRFEPPSFSAYSYPNPEDYASQPIFHNQLLDFRGLVDARFTGKQISRNLYAGCSYFSVNTDDADIDRYISCSGIKPVFMDNSMQMFLPWEFHKANDPWYPGKIRLYNIFEPYGNEAIQEYFPKLDTATFFINLPAGSEIDIIRLATAADFMWNAAAYSKDKSLWKVLQSRYGAETSRKLISYADKYSLMLEMLSRLKITSQMPRNLRNEQQILSELNALVDAVSARLGSEHRLVVELTLLNSELEAKLRDVSSNVKEMR